MSVAAERRTDRQRAASGGSGAPPEPDGTRQRPPRPAGASRAAERMTDSDALLWTIGRDPLLRSTVVAVALLDRPPRLPELLQSIEQLTVLFPRFRSRPVPAGIGWRSPGWAPVPDFDLSTHVRRMAAPAPGTLRQVLDVAQAEAAVDLDPQLPLWQALLVEGLADGGAAIVVKFHHAMVDGLGGVGVLLQLLQRQRRRSAASSRGVAPIAGGPGPDAAGRLRPVAPHGLERLPGPPELVRGLTSLARVAGGAPGLVRRLPQVATHLPEVLGSGPRLVARARVTAESVGRLLAPAGRPLSPVMVARGLARRFETIDLTLAGFRAAAAAIGGGVTVNDVLVAGVLDGFRRYHRLHGDAVDRLRVLVPISVRRPSDPLTVNRFVPARMVLPLQPKATVRPGDPLPPEATVRPGDPLPPEATVRQVRRISDELQSWKQAPALGLSDVLASVLAHLPPAATTATFGSMLKGDDVAVTNVPGAPFETFLAGARVRRLYAFAPPSGAAANISLVATAGRVAIGCAIDAAAVPDPAVLARCIGEGLHGVLALGRPARRRPPQPRAEGPGPVRRPRAGR